MNPFVSRNPQPQPSRSQSSHPRESSRHGVTLVEVCIAMLLLALMMGGILTSLVAVRRSAEASIRQNVAMDAAQSCLEQLRVSLWNFNSQTFPYSPTTGSTTVTIKRLNRTTTAQNVTLNISAGTAPDLTTLTPGVTPAGATDNPTTVELILDDNSTTAMTTMNMNMWVWLENRSVPIDAVYGQTCGITLIYSWQYNDGRAVRRFTRALKTMTSSIKSI